MRAENNLKTGGPTMLFSNILQYGMGIHVFQYNHIILLILVAFIVCMSVAHLSKISESIEVM